MLVQIGLCFHSEISAQELSNFQTLTLCHPHKSRNTPFLITSPLVNEVAIAIFIGIFGWKVTLIYAGSGIVLGTIVGWFLGKMKLEPYIEDWVQKAIAQQSVSLDEAELTKPSFQCKRLMNHSFGLELRRLC